MRKFSLAKLGILALALVPVCLVLLAFCGEESIEKKGIEPAAKKGEAGLPVAYRSFAERPDLHSAAQVRFKLPSGRERILYIVPQNKGSDLFVKGLYFYTPAWCLAENPQPKEGYPTVVQEDPEEQPDGSTKLSFKAILYSDTLTRQARDALLQQPQARALWTRDGLKEDDIQVNPWPVVHAVVGLVDLRDESSFIAVGQSEIRGESSTEFGFRLTERELATVRSLASKGRLGFVYSYSFIGKGQDYGEIDLEAVKNLSVSLKSKLSSEQLKGQSPIFQAEADEAARYVALLVRRTGRSNNPNVLAMVNTPSLMQHLFAPDGEITLENLRKGDEERLKQIAAYLTPQIRQLRQAFRAEQATRKTAETTDFDISESDDSASFGIGFILKGVGLNFGLGTSAKHTRGRELKKRLESATGTEWQVGKEETTLIPHKIRTYKFVQGSDQTLLTEQSCNYIAVGGTENHYYQEKAIPIAFTEKWLEKSAPHQGSPLPGYEGIPLGTVLPFFGVKPPKGYRWCDGNDPKDYPKGDNVFPHAPAWVPSHLLGKPLPDMRKYRLIGGTDDTKDEKSVGAVYNKGALTVDGKNFSVETKTETRDAQLTNSHALLGEFDGSHFASKVLIPTDAGEELFERQGNSDVCLRRAGGRGNEVVGRTFLNHFYGKLMLQTAPKYTDNSPGNVGGSQTLSLEDKPECLPAHLMCRWIIRVE